MKFTSLQTEEKIVFAALIGSRARGDFHEESDWDFALQWDRSLDFFEMLGRTESLRAALAEELNVPSARIDIVDIKSAGLAMRDVIASEGILIKGDGSLAWSHFLLSTWRQLEDYQWEQTHAI